MATVGERCSVAPSDSTGVRTAAITASRICSRIGCRTRHYTGCALISNRRPRRVLPDRSRHRLDRVASGSQPARTGAGYDIWWSVVEVSPSNTVSSGAVKPTGWCCIGDRPKDAKRSFSSPALAADA